jgi:hypothetical protein
VDHIATFRILDESRLRGLVQKDRYITYGGYPTAPTYWMTTKGEPLCVAGADDLINYFGVTPITSIQRDWLPAN